jgi:DNA repair protein RadB
LEIARVSTGSPDLDDLLGGGLEPRILHQFYGEAGSGKSAACIICAVECLRKGSRVIYIDTEGFSAERFRQIAGDEAESLASRLFLYEPGDFDQQGFFIGECEKILKSTEIGLIILDSATGLYRPEVGAGGDAQRRLGYQLLRLLGYARRYKIPVIITNQVYLDIDRNVLVGLGGTILRHLSKVIVRFEKVNARRRAVLEKHRSMPEDRAFDFLITERGFKRI